MNHFRLETCAETGRVVLSVDGGGGFRPLLSWSRLAEVEAFAEMLLGMYWRARMRELEMEDAVDDLLHRAFGEQRFTDDPP